MTATELYAISPEFRALMAAWDADKRCPYGMGDFLDEHDMPEQAMVARWAATEEDRPVFGEAGILITGVYPCKSAFDNHPALPWYYCAQGNYSDCLRKGMGIRGNPDRTPGFTSSFQANLWLLDNVLIPVSVREFPDKSGVSAN